MKKIYSILFCATVAILFSACTRQESSVNDSETIRFLAGPIETRTQFGSKADGKYPTLWTNKEDVRVAVNYTGSTDAAVTPSSDFKTAKFEAELTLPEAGPFTFMALSPASASVSLSAGNKCWTVFIPSSQTPLAGSVDEAAQIIAAVSAPYDEVPESVAFQFKHVTAYGHFSIKNLDLSGRTVQSVTLTSSTPFVGLWNYNLESPESSDFSDDSSSAITLMTDSVDDIWFACAPVNLSGETLKVTVTTDNGSYEKMVTCPASAELSSGDVFKFAVDFSGIDIHTPQKYVLVTDAGELTPDSQVIIVNKEDKKAISTTQTDTYRKIVSIKLSSDRSSVTDPADGVQVFIVEDGSATGSVAFKCVNGDQAGKYIYAASSRYDYLRSQANLDENASWAVTITEEGIAEIVAQGSNTHNTMRYNAAGAGRVSAYASTATDTDVLSVYKLEGSGSVIDRTPLNSPQHVIATLDANTPNAIEVVWDVVSGAAYYEVTAMPASGDTVTMRANSESANLAELAYETTYTISVVAYPTDIRNYTKSEPSNPVTVTTGVRKGALSNPYTVAEAIEAVKAVGKDKKIDDVHVTGIVSQISEISTEHGYATYFISDDGTTGAQFRISRGYYLEGAKFTSQDQLQVGDKLTVLGSILWYQGETPEMANGGKLVSLGRFDATISGTNVDAETTEATVTVTGNVDWTATVTGTDASVTPTSGTGPATVKVSFPENTSNADKTFTVTVSTTADVKTESFSYTITQAKPIPKQTVVFEVGANKDIISIFPAVKDGIKFAYTKGANGTAPVFNSPFIWHKNNIVTISGATIREVVFTFPSSYYAKTMTPDSGEYVLKGTEGTWTGKASSVVFTNGDAPAQFTKVKVVYQGTGSETVGTYEPSISFAQSAITVEVGQSMVNAATTNSPGTVTYSSSKKSVATVDQTGKVTGVAEGTATITASVAAVNGTCTKIKAASRTATVTVPAPPPVEVYKIVFGNHVSMAEPINSTTKASAVISSGTQYVTTQPFTVNTGSAYYGDAQNCIRIGKNGAASKVTIALSEAGQVEASSIIVKCRKMSGTNNNDGQLKVNGVGPKSPADYASGAAELVFDVSTTLESFVLEGTAAILIYSITVMD